VFRSARVNYDVMIFKLCVQKLYSYVVCWWAGGLLGGGPQACTMAPSFPEVPEPVPAAAVVAKCGYFWVTFVRNHFLL